MRIQDNVFLITGGASGLGAAAAQALVEAGGKVVLVDLDETAAQATAHALGANAFSVVADIRDETAARHAVSAARERFGALHGLVNCAGVAGGEKVLGRNGPHSLDSFTRIVGINLIGIRVMTIAPGVFETPMMAGMTQEIRDSLAAGVPFPPRLGYPAEYAAMVRHIFENSMLNGEVIRLDGALRMAAK